MKSIPVYLINRVIRFFEGISNYFNLMADIFRSYKSWGYYIKLSNIYPDMLVILCRSPGRQFWES